MCNIDHDFDLRCGRNNCIEFRSWAAPTADCCVTLPQDPLAKTVDVSAITEQIPEVNATEQATVCSNGGECDHPANGTGLMAWNVMVEDPRTNIEFSFNITNTNERNWKRGKKIKKKRNGRKKKKKKGKRSRGRKMRKQGVKRDSDDECPEGGWVMIAEGEPKRTNPHVILNKTCLPSLRSRTITAFSNRVQVYFQQGTGQKTHFELTAKASDRTEPAKCLDDCKSFSPIYCNIIENSPMELAGFTIQTRDGTSINSKKGHCKHGDETNKQINMVKRVSAINQSLHVV